MPDKLTPERRSENMRRIKNKDTKPELVVRRTLHRLGYRYRLHRKDLPGKPDLAFASRRKAIFVHGCFWHQHPTCAEGRPPRSNGDYWGPKLARNVQRDQGAIAALEAMGWTVTTVWECELVDIDKVAGRLIAFLDG